MMGDLAPRHPKKDEDNNSRFRLRKSVIFERLKKPRFPLKRTLPNYFRSFMNLPHIRDKGKAGTKHSTNEESLLKACIKQGSPMRREARPDQQQKSGATNAQ